MGENKNKLLNNKTRPQNKLGQQEELKEVLKNYKYEVDYHAQGFYHLISIYIYIILY